jgi:hypothetical protein
MEKIKVGDKFNLLEVTSIETFRVGHCTMYPCICECGKETYGTSTALRQGLKKSCGCLKRIAPTRGRKLHRVVNDVEEKHCSKCNVWKSIDNFRNYDRKWDGLRSHCKICEQKKINKRWKERWHNDPIFREKEKIVHRKYNTSERHLRKKKRRLERMDKDPEYAKNYRKKKSEYCKKYRENITNKIAHNMRVRVCGVFRRKSSKTEELIGCSYEFLKDYLEKQFLPGMTWECYGKKSGGNCHEVWEIDHIKPVCSFNLEDPEQVKECFHYTNLRPLWKIDNIREGCKAKKIKYKKVE